MVPKKKVVKKAAVATDGNTTKAVVGKKVATPTSTKVATKAAVVTKAAAKPAVKAPVKAAPAKPAPKATKPAAKAPVKAAPASKNANNKVAPGSKSAPASKKAAPPTKKAVARPTTVTVQRGGQATQDAWVAQLRNNLNAAMELMGEDFRFTTSMARVVKAINSLTLQQITDESSVQDTHARMYYARRTIQTRITAPPLARDGLKTLMLAHQEIKVRKIVGDDTDFKYFGDNGEVEGTFDAVPLLDDEGNEIREGGTYDIAELEASVAEGDEGAMIELSPLSAEEIEAVLPPRKEEVPAPAKPAPKAKTAAPAKPAAKKAVAKKAAPAPVEDDEEEVEDELIETDEEVVDEDGEVVDGDYDEEAEDVEETDEEDDDGVEAEDSDEDIEGSGDEDEDFSEFFEDED